MFQLSLGFVVTLAILASSFGCTSTSDGARVEQRSVSPDDARAGDAAVRERVRAQYGERLADDERFRINYRELERQAGLGTRIVGGQPTTDFRDCVAVGSATDWCCTGTLIDSAIVLTAGHCHDGDCHSRVYFGNDVSQPGQTIAVSRAIRHPQYDASTYANDLAVLVLERAPDNVVPRARAAGEVVDRAGNMRAVGFGTTNTAGTVGYGKKRMVDLPVAAPVCTVSDSQTYCCHVDKEIVAGARSLDKDTCRGDSGGPLYVQVSGQWALAGVTSRATCIRGARTCGDGGNYVRVDRYAAWIDSEMQNAGRP